MLDSLKLKLKLKPHILFASYLYFISHHQIILSFPNNAVTSRRGAIHQTSILLTATTRSSTSSNNSNSMSDSIHWGIVGLGDVCKVKSGPPFYKCNGSELVAVMRRTPGKAKEFAAQVPNGNSNACVGYEDLNEFLEHPGLDAVYVSTRPGTHLDICREVAKAGKACYVEKPVGRCAQETEEIVKMFQDAGRPLYTAYISRAYDKTQAIRKLMDDGVLGDKIINVSYKCIGQGGAKDMDGALPWRLDAEQSGGGLVMDVGCHVIDRIDYLFGPLTDIIGEAKNLNSPGIAVEDYIHITAIIGKSDWAVLTNNQGCNVECTWDFASNEIAFDELKIIGSNHGYIVMRGSPSDPIKVYNTEGDFVEELTFEMPEHTGQVLIQAVTDDLRGLGKRSYLSYGENAIRTQKALDACLISYYGGRESGYWLRSQSWPGKPQ